MYGIDRVQSLVYCILLYYRFRSESEVDRLGVLAMIILLVLGIKFFWFFSPLFLDVIKLIYCLAQPCNCDSHFYSHESRIAWLHQIK